MAQVNLAKYPETAKILHPDIFWFFLCDEDFVSRTIAEGSVDLDKFPASRVCQLAKKFESSKATAQHTKQVAGDLQATQINFMRHQLTELPTNRQNKKRRPTSRLNPHKAPENSASKSGQENLMTTGSHIGHMTAVINVAAPFMHKDSNALQRSTSAKFATNMVTFPAYATKRRPRCITRTVVRNPKVHQLHAGPMYAQDSANHSYSKESSSDESFCLQLQAQSNHAEGKADSKSCPSDNEPCILLETTSHQKHVPAGTIRHMCRCEHHAS